jgi:hypothetical protein
MGMSAGCVEEDVILPVVVMGWLESSMNCRWIVEEIAGRSLVDVHDVFSCMMRRHYERTLSFWGTKGFAVWVRMMDMNKDRLIRELNEM